MSIRKFIFLEQIDSGYTLNNKELKGHIKVVQKNSGISVAVYIENIIPGEYSIYAVDKDNILTRIGNINDFKNEKKFEIKKQQTDIQGLVICPLHGDHEIVACAWFSDEHVNVNLLKNNIYNYNNKTINSEKKSTASEKKENFNEKNDQKKYINIEDENTDNIKSHLAQNSSEVVENKTDEKYEDGEIKGFQNDFHETGENNLDNEKKDKESDFKGGVYNNQIYYLWQNVEKLDNILERYEPFNEKIPNHKWWNIDESNIEVQYYCILYNGYLMPMIYPFMNYKNILKDKNNWVFGIVTEDYNGVDRYKYFVYGIPGRFYMQEQPFKGSTGYLYWQSRDVEKNDPMGYWLLYVDVHTGKIVIPRRPVKPPLNKNIMHNNI